MIEYDLAPTEPATIPPHAVLFGTTPDGTGSYYKLGDYVWVLAGTQWTMYGFLSEWPYAANEEAPCPR